MEPAPALSGPPVPPSLPRMLPAPHLLRRSPRLWALGLLAWLALALQGGGVLAAVHPAMHGGMGTLAAAAMHHAATLDAHTGMPDCCGAAGGHCACPANCTAALPILPDSAVLAPLPPSGSPAGSAAGTAPRRFGSPPLRPPLV